MRIRWFAGLMGMGIYLVLLGCGGSGDSQSEPSDVVDNHADAHDHSAAGPHGGHMIVLGDEEFHAELTHDEATHTVSIYLLDSTGKESVSSEQESITLQVFKDGDFVDCVLKAAGDEGAFSAVDEQLCHLLLHAEKVNGRLHATIAGTEYVGAVELAAHGHAGHGHEEESEAHGEDGHEHGEESAAHGEDGHEHGEESTAHGEDGHEHGEESTAHGEDGHEHEKEGTAHDHDGHADAH